MAVSAGHTPVGLRGLNAHAWVLVSLPRWHKTARITTTARHRADPTRIPCVQIPRVTCAATASVADSCATTRVRKRSAFAPPLLLRARRSRGRRPFIVRAGRCFSLRQLKLKNQNQA